MEKIIQKIKSNTFLTIITAILLGLLVLFSIKFPAQFFSTLIGNYIELDFYTKNSVGKFFMLIFSIALILFINKGNLKGYGFKLPANVKYLKLILITIGITIAGLVVGGLIFFGLLSQLFPTENTTAFPDRSIITNILTVWIWSSICEEVFVRGLIQGFMQHLKSIRFLRLSLPVIISGLFFGCMHLSLLNAGMGHWFVGFIIFNATVVGLLAAYYREKHESLISPILIHFLANVIGSIPLILSKIIETV